MDVATSSHKLIKKVKDECFDEENIHQYRLLLNIGVHDFQILVCSEKNRVLLLEDYVFTEVTSAEAQLQTLMDIFEEHAVLSAGFWKQVKISFKTQKFVQVPVALFQEESMHQYLAFNAYIDSKKETILKIEHQNHETVTVFAVSKELLNWLLSRYPLITPILLHQSVTLAEGMLSVSRKEDNQLYVYIDRFRIHIIVCRQHQLIYYNQFAIHHFQDYIKYIVMVMKLLGIRQDTGKVMLYGYIGDHSSHYNELKKYIGNIHVGTKPDFLRFGYVFDELQSHHYYDTYSIALLN